MTLGATKKITPSRQILEFPRDEHGHLTDAHLWQEAWISSLAQEIPLSLTSRHMQAILWLRDYYLQYHHFPTIRYSIKALREVLQEPEFDSIQLHILFPQSPLRYMSYCAGLPKPPHCL